MEREREGSQGLEPQGHTRNQEGHSPSKRKALEHPRWCELLPTWGGKAATPTLPWAGLSKAFLWLWCFFPVQSDLAQRP